MGPKSTYRKDGGSFVAELSAGSIRRLRLALDSGSSSASQDFRLLDSAIGSWGKVDIGLAEAFSAGLCGAVGDEYKSVVAGEIDVGVCWFQSPYYGAFQKT